MTYPRRLIEVDLPIKRISAHARREKSIRHGHISTLHIWWARRPLAACRAVICAALWPDPADPLCPQAFREAAAERMLRFAEQVGTDRRLAELCPDTFGHWQGVANGRTLLDPAVPAHWNVLRFSLLEFIADFANWDASTVPAFLETARALTQAAHEALGGEPGTRPLVVDPFAGGGSIPLEALRVGADAFASDLNPVAVLLNKVVLEYIPRYGQRLADEVRKWGQWVKERAEEELAEFYPKDPDGATPIAYLWARTIRCEGPGCGAEVPLIRSLWLCKKRNRAAAIRLVPNPAAKRVDFEVFEPGRASGVGNPTVARGSATCPCCGYTTPVASVREQLKARHGGAADARLFCVVSTRPGELGRHYRLPTERDLEAVRRAGAELGRRMREHTGELSLVPEERISLNEIRRISVPLYGMGRWCDLFTPRQLLALTTLAAQVNAAGQRADGPGAEALQVSLALALSRIADRSSSIYTWRPQADQEKVEHAFARQAIPMTWDFAEGTPLTDGTAGWTDAYEPPARLIEAALASMPRGGQAQLASATKHPLPDDAAWAVVTDPPYYDAVPYAYLSDYFYVWLRRGVGAAPVLPVGLTQVPKDEEIVVDRPHELSDSHKDIAFYEGALQAAFRESRRVLMPQGIGVIVFASKTTASWEAILQAVLDAGWTVTASWPVDTEMAARVAAQGQARLASSIHLVCRPRESADGSLITDSTGDWRDVLAELPGRIHDWLPRLAQEGVVGADAIFACLGPALEIFSRYSRVEKASGERVELREYLEQVWAAVAREALGLVFEGSGAAGLEEDARLTAMWLWTLSTNDDAGSGDGATPDTESEDDESQPKARAATAAGFVLEYDAARKIAQGLGAHLEELGSVVQVKGDKATLLAVSERAAHLFGKEAAGPSRPRRARTPQMSFADIGLTEPEPTAADLPDKTPEPGQTVLDRVHQAMLLFGNGRAEAMAKFLVEDGAGNDPRFWHLAQALSALYPVATQEKRWVDGVLARKKGLGF